MQDERARRYGLYYDRITLEIQSLERGLDGRALPVEVRAGNVFFLDPSTGTFPPFAPSFGNPFTGFILPGAGASGINIIDNGMENPTVQQFNLGVQHELPGRVVLRVDGIHNLGTHFIIGRTIGTVFNPVVGGDDRVVNLESSVNTHYDALLVSAEKRGTRFGFRAGYTLAKAFNYANDDQIPFSNGPIDPQRSQARVRPDTERSAAPVHACRLGRGTRRHPRRADLDPGDGGANGYPDARRPVACADLPAQRRRARVHERRRSQSRAGGYQRSGGINGVPLPLVGDSAQFSDSFNSLDARISRPFNLGHIRLEPMLEIFNVFNVTNILGVSVRNYSGFSNVLVRDSNNPDTPGFLRSSAFGQPVTSAGGVFGSGGPRAFQFGLRATF